MFKLIDLPATAVYPGYRWLNAAVITAWLTASPLASAVDSTDYTITSQGLPELTLFNPKAITQIDFIRTVPTVVGQPGNFLSLCDGAVGWVKGYTDVRNEAEGKQNQRILDSFIIPELEKEEGRFSEKSVTVDMVQNTPYYLYLPLSPPPLNTDQADFVTGDHTVTFGIRKGYPFDQKCQPGSGVTQVLEPITVPVRSIADATPVIQPLVPEQQVLAADGTTFTANVEILGVTPANTVLWIDDNNPNGLTMTRTKQITTEANTELGFKGNEPIGGWYSVTLPVPTQLSYSAKVQVKKDIKNESNSFEETMVNGVASQPYLKVSGCSDSQCLITTNSVIPYRDINGSLGLSLKSKLPLVDKTQLPTAIFTMQQNSEWKQVTLFNGQSSANQAQSNWKLYSGESSPFLTSLPLPQQGVFLLKFETTAP